MMPGGGSPSTSVAKYIYIARNPKDVAVSYYYHVASLKQLDFDRDWDCFYELFMKDEVPFGSWFNHTLDWWLHKNENNILFMKYEDMKIDLKASVKRIAYFMGYQLDDHKIEQIYEQCTFEAMKSNPLADPDHVVYHLEKMKEDSTPFLRKGIIGDWRNHFTNEQSLRLNEEYMKRMDGSGLEFVYEFP
jgi:hypothetical protein